MTEEPQQRQEIAELEQWLAKALPTDTPRSVESLKLRARVELNERWLRDKWDDQTTKTVSKCLRDAVRNAAREERRHSSALADRHHPGAWRWMSGAALGLAAMLLFSVAVYRSNPAGLTETDDDVTAFVETADEQEFDDELDEALAELDDLLASRDETEWNDVLEGL